MSSASLGLYRQLLRESRKITDYNFRAYAKRRSRLGFEQGRNATGADLEARLEEGRQQLELMRRQALLSQMYPAPESSVMESSGGGLRVGASR